MKRRRPNPGEAWWLLGLVAGGRHAHRRGRVRRVYAVVRISADASSNLDYTREHDEHTREHDGYRARLSHHSIR
jgi:hypothetical protein